jgi:proteasome lid subunit RPN8/RPN11
MESIMTAKEIQIPRKIANQLLHLAQLSPEQEVCGLIGAINNIARTCYPINNTAEQPKTRFQLDSKQHINAISNMRDKNEALFAIYHSHPTAPAIPSATDIKLATHPDVVHLIISLNTKGVLEIRGFSITEGAVEELVLSLPG